MWSYEEHSSNQKRNGGGSVKVTPVRKRITGAYPIGCSGTATSIEGKKGMC